MKVPIDDELTRVIVHGLCHLLGYTHRDAKVRLLDEIDLG